MFCSISNVVMPRSGLSHHPKLNYHLKMAIQHVFSSRGILCDRQTNRLEHPVEDRIWLLGHLVDAYGDRQDEDIVLSGLDLHTVGITYAKPLL